MITLQQLKDMKPGEIFATGIINDGPTGINLANTGKTLRWVACAGRGGVGDWAIYAHTDDHDAEWIQQQGDKVQSEENIKKLVPCDDEAFGRYRH